MQDFGRHADGGGLYLSISPNGGRRWVFLFRRQGKQTELGFGSVRDISLARARELASMARQDLANGLFPKRARLTAQTFGECADRLIASMSSSWRNEKHAAQWKMTLTVYAAPLRNLPVTQVSTTDVLSVLKTIWLTKPETANRLRGRIERVIDAAKAEGLRDADNPARWRGHLENLLPKRPISSRGHYAAMAIDELPKFMKLLDDQSGTASKALKLLILTASRTSEVIKAKKEEVRIDDALWVIPAVRTKSGREHRVPLSETALSVVRSALFDNQSDYIFEGQKPGSPLSLMALEMLLRRMKVENATVHGFRSTFRDWAAERTNFPNEVCEAALAHSVRDKTEAAYRRGDLLLKRRKLMEMWASFCEKATPLQVIAINNASAHFSRSLAH